VPPRSIWRAIPGDRAKRLHERYHPQLADARVVDFTASLLMHEAGWQLAGQGGWDLFMARNAWFQRSAASALESLRVFEPRIVFAHSYAARDIFRTARARGWQCVLGQIDPGERHFAVVQSAANAAPEFGAPPPQPPASYLADWREECALADRIIVNSEWSRTCVIDAGVDAAKMMIVPLAYEPETTATAAAHVYPERFTAERPLRLLFVGQASVAKGIKPLLESIGMLTDVPLELTVVGEQPAAIPSKFTSDARIRFAGPVSRSAVMAHYRDADLLVFPSLSDGFGMAQVEAQGWRLPIIASPSSGRVVRDGVNGIVLDEVGASAIATAIRAVATNPAMLARFSQQSMPSAESGIDALGAALVSLEAA
jgi:glycosyltransferase involved in cell wall biosynthesis